MQGQLEVGVRLVLKARHMANELPNVALLLRVPLAPMQSRPRHTAGTSTATPLRELVAALARVHAPASLRLREPQDAVARVRLNAALLPRWCLPVMPGCFCQSHLGTLRSVLKELAVRLMIVIIMILMQLIIVISG